MGQAASACFLAAGKPREATQLWVRAQTLGLNPGSALH